MQESGCGRKGWTAGRFSQTGDALRPPYPHLLIEDQAGKLSRAVQLTGAPSQHDPPARYLVEPACLQTIAREFEGFFDPRCDNSDEQRFGHVIDMPVILLTDLRDGDHLALVGAR